MLIIYKIHRVNTGQDLHSIAVDAPQIIFGISRVVSAAPWTNFETSPPV